jgi:glucose/arabinose dehydrogenase
MRMPGPHSPSKNLFLVSSLLLFTASPRAARGDAKDVKLDTIKLPPGFRISVYSDSVPGARSMTMGPRGTLFVGSRDAGVVYAVVDAGDGTRAREVLTLAKNLNEPNGVAVKGGALYVMEVSRLLRFDDVEEIFIAEHGSWNRKKKVGYRVALVRLRDGKPISEEAFAEGWLQGVKAWGRPVDVLVRPDGALLVSDDQAGAIYRISFGN